tara:strand:+ start:4142 stop:4480 length:339 start_codon:yes stop_codon:yes gene_type:complete
MIIYKILRADEWASLRDNGTSAGAPIDVADGYIHFSTADTVVDTAAKHFSREDDLMLLAYNDTDFGDAIRYEKSRDDLLFPHLYAPLKLDGALWIKPLPFDGKTHIFPNDIS